jgi:hypothetical protein
VTVNWQCSWLAVVVVLPIVVSACVQPEAPRAHPDTELSPEQEPADSSRTNDAPPLGRGRLVVRWSVEGTLDDRTCREQDIDLMTVEILTLQGLLVERESAPCEEFESAFDLPPGDYLGRAFLVDFDGNPRTTVVQFGLRTIVEGEEDVIEVDFPTKSFLQ